MFHPPDGGLDTVACPDMFGTKANPRRPCRRVAESRGWQQVDMRLAKARGDIDGNRSLVDLTRGAELDQPALVKDADMGGHGHRLYLIMGHVQKGCAKVLVDSLQLDPKIGAQFGVQRGQRFVHQVDARLAHQCAADGNALHLAPRQRGGLVVQLVRDAQNLGHLLHPSCNLGLGQGDHR